MEDWSAAQASYRAAAASYPDVPVARVLGHAYAARIAEALGNFDRAVIDYTAAHDAWDLEHGAEYSLYVLRPPTPNEPFQARDDTRVVRAALPDRIAQLSRSASLPGGDLLERGRWLLDKGRQQEAIAAFTDLLTRYPQSGAVSEARVLVLRARLDRALDLADVEKASRDESAAIAMLDEIGRETPYTFGVCAAKIAKACLLGSRGQSADADTLMTEALREWSTRRLSRAASSPSASTVSSASNAALHRDVAEIHTLVFRPKGDGIYAAGRDWEAFRRAASSSAPPPFMIVNPDQKVKLPNGDTIRVSLTGVPRAAAESSSSPSSAPKVLWLDDAELATLTRVMTRLGGTKVRPWSNPIQVPNQPIGPSLDILAFWNTFFPARPGHWGGWMFETFPRVDEIEFLDAPRTRAAARVTIGYEGGTVVLEKDHGTWVVKGLVNRWIT